jgi:cysteine desulfurase family protein (TIGR01976 family)
MDISQNRTHFPALLKTDWILADNAGGSQTLKGVAEKAAAYLLDPNVQLGASYDASVICLDKYHQGNKALQLLINAADVCEVVTGSSSTAVVSNFATAMTPAFIPGQEIIVADTDHESNISFWMRAAESRGCTVKFWKVNHETYMLELEDLKNLLTEKTRLVACTQCSNILGSIHDVKAFAKLVHTIPGAEIFVDGVAFGPHRLVDVQDWDVDYYVLSVYKIYGPHISVGYAKKKCMENLACINHSSVNPNDMPYKIQPGRGNYELTYSTTAIVEYISGLGIPGSPPSREGIVKGFDIIQSLEVEINKQIFEGLRRLESRGLKVIGTIETEAHLRVPTIGFVVKGLKSSEIVALIDKKKVAVRHGDFYATRLVKALNLKDEYGGVVRVSFVHYNTKEEVNRFLTALNEVLNELGK